MYLNGPNASVIHIKYNVDLLAIPLWTHQLSSDLSHHIQGAYSPDPPHVTKMIMIRGKKMDGWMDKM